MIVSNRFGETAGLLLPLFLQQVGMGQVSANILVLLSENLLHPAQYLPSLNVS
jgi:hypothetical protein